MVLRYERAERAAGPSSPWDATSGLAHRLSASGWPVLVLGVLFFLMMILGLIVGDVFETYHTGSSL